MSTNQVAGFAPLRSRERFNVTPIASGQMSPTTLLHWSRAAVAVEHRIFRLADEFMAWRDGDGRLHDYDGGSWGCMRVHPEGGNRTAIHFTAPTLPDVAGLWQVTSPNGHRADLDAEGAGLWATIMAVNHISFMLPQDSPANQATLKCLMAEYDVLNDYMHSRPDVGALVALLD